MENYTIYHLHSDLSTGVTSIDSVTKPAQYIARAKECGMKALAFSEHGSVFMWVKKKQMIEAAGMKYIHAEEFYLTETLEDKIKDNYHIVLIAKNYDGVLELNTLSSRAFNRTDNHYYYVPRISMDELTQTSDNIMVTSACLASPLSKCTTEFKDRFLRFLIAHKDRCYLEIQHHSVEDQKTYNQWLYTVSQEYGIPLIAGTDTHALNAEHAEARIVLQKSKNIRFADEETWDLTFKTYDELIHAYEIQGALPMDVVREAIANTNAMADRVEEFTLDKSYKYPALWDNPKKVFIKKIKEGIKRRGVDKYPNRDEYAKRIEYEIKAYEHNGAFDFMLLMEDIISWCRSQDIPIGYGRGSVNGSVCAWLLGITEMDAIKHNLNFDRFMNVERVSLSDIDTDFPPNRIDEVKQYVFNHHGLYCSDIITFNTIADKGAIRDVVRGLYKIPDIRAKLSPAMQQKYDEWQRRIAGHDSRDMCMDPPADLAQAMREAGDDDYIQITKDVLAAFERSENEARKKYPEVFKYVDICKGVVVSIGSHPCGLVVAPYPIDDKMGLCTTSTDPLPISQIYMKEIDGLNYVKLDLLKLDTIQLIHDACKAANIDMLTPDNTDINDVDVWNSIRDNTVGIFQWEGATGDGYIKKLMSDDNIRKLQQYAGDVDRMTLLTIGNSAIRPAGASYREDLASGVVRKSGSAAIDDFLKPTFGYLVFQCQIIEFLHSYCGFTMGEADIVRRCFAKKLGTEAWLPIIKNGGTSLGGNQRYIPGFINTMKEKYDMSVAEAEQTITSFLKVIEDASDYLFSVNHSTPYSYEGYACGWLRYYYPLQFLTCALNICKDNEEKTLALIAYAKSQGIKLMPPKFGFSKNDYEFDIDTNAIYKGLSSVKFLGDNVSEELDNLSDEQYGDFVDLLVALQSTSINSKQLKILINIGFFDKFGCINELLREYSIFDSLYGRKQLKTKDLDGKGVPQWIAEKHSIKHTEKTFYFDNTVPLIKDIIANTEHLTNSIIDQIKGEVINLGCGLSTAEVGADWYCIQGIGGFSNNVFTLYQIRFGTTETYKFDYKCRGGLDVGDVIRVNKIEHRHKRRKVDDKWVEIDDMEDVVTSISRFT